MNKMTRWSVLLLSLAMLLAFSACGGDKTETTAPTKETTDGHAHVYAERVIEPTCVEDGFTVYTCECGHKYTGNKVPKTGRHTWELRTVRPSVKTDTFGIDAISFDARVCAGCGQATYYTANLVDLTFDEDTVIPTDYVPSENYNIAMENLEKEAEEMKLTGEEAEARMENWAQMLKLIDSQKYLTCWENGSGIRGAHLENDALIGDWQFFVHDDLGLFSDAPAFETFSMTFDLTINGDPTRWTDGHGYAPIFGVCGGKATGGGATSMWRSPMRLEIARKPNSQGKYEFFASYATGAADVWSFVSTGKYLELGKAYTFRIDVDRTQWETGEKPHFALSYKEASSDSYISLGEYEFYPSSQVSAFKIFDPGCAVGNVFDNFKIFVELEDE